MLGLSVEAREVKTFACGDVVPGCDATWVCSTDDEILALVAEHAAAAHGGKVFSLELADSVSKHIVTSS